MKIGHICLAPAASEAGEQFAGLVEAIAVCRQDIEQHVLVASVALARRLARCDRVAVGPVVKSPVMAYCLMPSVDLVHIHEADSGQAGLLLTLTRRIPYVISIADSEIDDKNPLTRSVMLRALHKLQCSVADTTETSAREHLSIYEVALSKIPKECQQPA